MLEVFLQSLLVGYSGAMMPGSLLTYTLNKSIKSGVKAGLLISLGHCILELILVILIFIGVGKYLQTSLAQLVIGIIGGIVLIFFGINMLRDAILNRLNIDFKNESKSKSGNLVISGALISATNPYFPLWWVAIGLGLITNAYNLFGLFGVVFFYLGHIIADLTWYGFISAVIGKTRNFINPKIYKIIITFLGLCLIGFGASFILGSIKIMYAYL